jgi:hypothetical protein
MIIYALMAAALAANANPEPRTSAAVIHADEEWGKAEIAGNADFLRQLLLPGYVSIGADGKVTTGEAIIAKARSRSPDERSQRAQAVAAWRAKHPVVADVTISGDTAVLRWVVPGASKLVRSSDIFVFDHGRWRAIYSQHSAASL